jgi:hypothetical protein
LIRAHHTRLLDFAIFLFANPRLIKKSALIGLFSGDALWLSVKKMLEIPFRRFARVSMHREPEGA